MHAASVAFADFLSDHDALFEKAFIDLITHFLFHKHDGGFLLPINGLKYQRMILAKSSKNFLGSTEVLGNNGKINW